MNWYAAQLEHRQRLRLALVYVHVVITVEKEANGCSGSMVPSSAGQIGATNRT